MDFWQYANGMHANNILVDSVFIGPFEGWGH